MFLHSGDFSTGLALTGYLLVVLACAGFGVQIARSGLLRRPLDGAVRALIVAVAASAAWGALALADLWSDKRWPWHLAVACDQLRYAAWIVFAARLLPLPWSSPRSPVRRGLLTALPLLLGAAGIGADLALGFGADSAAAAMRVLVASQLGWAVLGLFLVEQLFRTHDEGSRWSIKPLCLGLACLFVYDVYLFSQALMFGAFDIDTLGARGLVHAAAVPFLVVATRRRSGWLTRVKVSNAAAFYSASLLLVGAYLLLVAAAGYYVRYFGGSWGGALQIALLAVAVAALAALVLSGSLRARLRVFLGKHLLRYRYDYRVEWLRFTARLSSTMAPEEIAGVVVRGLADMVESPAGALWFKAGEGDRLVSMAVWNMPRSSESEAADSPLCRFMRERDWIVDLDAVRSGHGPRDEAEAVPAWLHEVGGAWLVVPLRVSDEVDGFVVLAQARTPLALNWEMRDLLKTAARQAAGVLAQMRATEALLEARKFDAFNRMSAFVVHDLKNIVTQLSLMLKNAERHRANPEFQQDMLATVENSLEKMRQMMLQLREGQAPADGAAFGVELEPILRRIQQSARRRGREVGLRSVERIATRGHEQRLERVIEHIVQNALDATPASGSVSVELERVGARVRLKVRDSGAGMTQEFIQTRLFRPFSSTKASGMGIGSYEALQYLRQIGGAIEVESEVGKGSVVALWMPLFESGAETERHPMRLAAERT
ncbi:MAG: XrtA/PEP-CTERM system histidine kinase PrsK [Rubrivivax sp.]